MSEHSIRDNSQVLPPEIPDAEGEVKKKLLVQIDWEKALAEVDKNGNLGMNRILYREEILPGIEFVISKSFALEGISFAIFPKDQLAPNNELADFVFCFRPKNGAIEIKHRVINDEGKKMGIDGDNFLVEAEKYMKFFLDAKGRKEDYQQFYMTTGQVSVVKWALKNGYGFKSKRDAEYYEEIISGRDDSVVITDDFKKPDGSYGNYMVEKYKMPDLLEKSKQGAVYIFEHSLRFKLIKDIWPEEKTEDKK